MNMVKVYNAKGEYVDSFRKMQSKVFIWYVGGRRLWKNQISQLNSAGFFIRKQLPKRLQNVARG